MRPVLLVLLTATVCATTFGASPEGDTSAPVLQSAIIIEEVLRTETATLDQTFDRRAALQEVLEQSPDLTDARWHVGEVLWDGEWRRAEEIPEFTRGAALLNEYRDRRDTTPRTAAAQLTLANWCRDAGLQSQEQAHLGMAVLLGREVDQGLRKRLGEEQEGGRWLSREEVAERSRILRETEDSLKEWGPKLQKLAVKLNGSKALKDSALAELQLIDDPTAIPAIQHVLAARGEGEALASIGILQRMPEYEATEALAWQALLSPFWSVREASTEALRTRRLEHFVPLLLSNLSTPLESQFSLTEGLRGDVVVAYLQFRETEDEIQVSRRLIRDWRDQRRLQNSRSPRDVMGALRARWLRSAIATRATVEFSGVEAQRARLSTSQANANFRISDILVAVSGQEEPADVRQWWDWWLQQNGRESGGPKRVVIVEEESTTRGTPLPSCLPAGTLIWTESGLRPIEEIQVGDRVLAKHPDTGELSYQTVQLTTVRSSSPMVRFEVGDDVLESTTGHHFWVSGQGWLKADELDAGMPLHTVTGMLLIRSVGPAADAPAYNLVISDAHTYFVGHSQILSHDVTFPAPTNSVVPGLSLRAATARQ